MHLDVEAIYDSYLDHEIAQERKDVEKGVIGLVLLLQVVVLKNKSLQ